jgi:hypothetical protein
MIQETGISAEAIHSLKVVKLPVNCWIFSLVFRNTKLSVFILKDIDNWIFIDNFSIMKRNRPTSNQPSWIEVLISESVGFINVVQKSCNG